LIESFYVQDLGERSIVDLCVGDLDSWLMSKKITIRH
jgi:hypothetical protein